MKQHPINKITVSVTLLGIAAIVALVIGETFAATTFGILVLVIIILSD